MNIAQRIGWRLVNTGATQTTYWLYSHFDTWRREWWRGIDTRGKLSADATPEDDCNGYEPIMYECLDCVFEQVPISDKDVLIDFGSGKGRVLIEASLKNFKRIEGVEYDPELVEVCRRNLQSFAPVDLDRRIIVHTCDAREFEIPDDASIAFLWNSIVGDALLAIRNRIYDFVVHRQRPLKLLLALPSGETHSLPPFQAMTSPRMLKTRFWTGVDLYLFEFSPDSIVSPASR